jgi:hypothetical protein
MKNGSTGRRLLAGEPVRHAIARKRAATIARKRAATIARKRAPTFGA